MSDELKVIYTSVDKKTGKTYYSHAANVQGAIADIEEQKTKEEKETEEAEKPKENLPEKSTKKANTNQ